MRKMALKINLQEVKMTNKLSQKSFPLSIKTLNDDGTFEAYGSVFGNVDSYGDVVVKGAFTKTLQDRGDKVRLLWQHDPAKPIGKFTAMSEDDYGLKCTGALNLNVQQGAEAYQHLKHGDLDGMSIGFMTVKSMDGSGDEDGDVRYLTELKLYEVSLVTFPANEEATVTQVRSAFEAMSQEDRIAVLGFINKSIKNPLSKSSEPPTEEASSGNTQETKTAGPETNQEPQSNVDVDALHSLEQLSLTLKALIK
jgi:HK97 family phage prohead protease